MATTDNYDATTSLSVYSRSREDDSRSWANRNLIDA